MVSKTTSSGISSGEDFDKCWTWRSSSCNSGSSACGADCAISHSVEICFASACTSANLRWASAKASSCSLRMVLASSNCCSICVSCCCKPWSSPSAAPAASRNASTLTFAALMQLPMALSIAGISRTRLRLPPDCAGGAAASAGMCRAAATASSCIKRNVFDTSLPFRTSCGSKKSMVRPSPALTASTMLCNLANLSSLASGQSSRKP
mmetsp:Transcript_57346/g.166486  ORF Transcript_57346/g.166486 Transcript_57346/m.166486 type:complete len:208 (-) Transcript_57346:2373-2996(-)